MTHFIFSTKVSTSFNNYFVYLDVRQNCSLSLICCTLFKMCLKGEERKRMSVVKRFNILSMTRMNCLLSAIAPFFTIFSIFDCYSITERISYYGNDVTLSRLQTLFEACAADDIRKHRDKRSNCVS